MTISEAIKKRIEDLCNTKKFSTNKLSTNAGITNSTISSILSGKTKVPKADTLYYICVGFDISLKDFFDDKIFEEIDED